MWVITCYSPLITEHGRQRKYVIYIYKYYSNPKKDRNVICHYAILVGSYVFVTLLYPSKLVMFFPRKTSDLHCLRKTRWSFLPFLKMLGGQATQYMGWHVFFDKLLPQRRNLGHGKQNPVDHAGKGGQNKGLVDASELLISLGVISPKSYRINKLTMAMNCPYNDLDALPSMKQNRAPTERRAGYLTYLWYRCLMIDYRHVSMYPLKKCSDLIGG